MMHSELLGWIAASLVFGTFCARRMVPLRAFAIASNIAFIGYGYLDHLWPIVILHVAMLPMNAIRFREAFLTAGSVADGHKRIGAAGGPTLRRMTEFSRDLRSGFGP